MLQRLLSFLCLWCVFIQTTFGRNIDLQDRVDSRYCSRYLTNILKNIDLKITVGKEYSHNTTLPWFIKHTGFNVNRIDENAILKKGEFQIMIPLTDVYPSPYFLKLNYKEVYYSNSQNEAVLLGYDIVNFEGEKAFEDKKEKFDEVFKYIRSFIRDRDAPRKSIDIEINQFKTITIYPRLSQSTVVAYQDFMEKFLYVSKFEVLRTIKNAGKKAFRKTLSKRVDQSQLSKITSYEDYQKFLSRLNSGFVGSLFTDQYINSVIWSIVGVAIYITLSGGKLIFKVIFSGSEQAAEDAVEDIANIPEKLEEIVGKRNVFEGLMNNDEKFKEAAEAENITADSIDIKVEVLDSISLQNELDSLPNKSELEN